MVDINLSLFEGLVAAAQILIPGCTHRAIRHNRMPSAKRPLMFEWSAGRSYHPSVDEWAVKYLDVKLGSPAEGNQDRAPTSPTSAGFGYITSRSQGASLIE